MEFNRSEEYRKLPDEFNRNLKQLAEEKGKRKSMLLLTACFVVMTMLVFPLTVSSHSHHHSPDWPFNPNPPVYQSYEIIGMWQCENEYYQFFEDGKGYWTNGTYFVLLQWQKAGDTYVVEGQGLFNRDEKNLTIGTVNFMTSYKNGNLILQRYSGDYFFTFGEFEPSDRSFNLEKIIPLYGTTIRTNLIGVWEHIRHEKNEEDGFYVCLSYLKFIDEEHVVFDLAGTSTADWAGYDLKYQPDSNYPDIHLVIGDGTRMYIEIHPSQNSTYTYESYELNCYRMITEDGESMLVTGMNDNILVKMNWEEN